MYTVEKVMLLLKRKLYKLMKGYKAADMSSSIVQSRDQYHHLFLDNHKGISADDNDRMSKVGEDDLLTSTKMTNVPNRKQIKALSARLMEAVAKRDDAA